MQAKSAADIAVRVIADIGFNIIAGIWIACVAMLIGANAQTAIAIAIIDIVFIFIVATVATIAILFVIFFVILPHIIAIAEALDDQTIALSAAVKLTTPTHGNE